MLEKTLFSFFYILVAINIVVAQAPSTESIFKKYQASSNTHFQSPYYLLEVNKLTPKLITTSIALKANRKFSDNLFIVSASSLKGININYIKKLYAVTNNWKLSAAAEISLVNDLDAVTPFYFQIFCTKMETAERLLALHKNLKNNFFILREQNIISVFCTVRQMQEVFLNEEEVVSIDLITTKPKEELGIPGFDLSANKINMVHSQYPIINGQGKHVSIKEDYYDTTDIDMKGRYDASPLASDNITNHANFMATIIAGAGNSIYYARGAADHAHISSSSFKLVLPDAGTSYLNNNITVQNHSYGTDLENNYGVSAMAFDKNAHSNEGLLHVFSSGNSGDKTSTTGNYTGIEGYANLTGNFKMAKNILVVGAVDSFGNVVPLSSKGPAYDGRIKPELVAFQKNGTSEAAALVSGTALLLQQYYNDLHPQNVLPSALAKAILINSADDISTPGPDFKTGYGNLNAVKAMDLLRDDHIFSSEIRQDSTQIFSILIPANIALLKVTLAWNDTAASPMANKALVNDVDLEVALPANNQSWQPWVLNSFANVDSLNSPAVRKKDSLNNVEQVTIENPIPGNYQLKIKGYNLPAGNQKYHVVYSLDSVNKFVWQAPDSTTLLQARTHAILRWQNSFNQSGRIEYSLAPNQWQLIADNADLKKSYFYWDVPDTISQVLFRMKIGNDYFYSDTCTITTLLKPTTGYICGDSILIYWNKLKGISRYQIYQLGDKFMEPLLSVSDTTAVVSKNILKNKYLAVAPVLKNGITAFKSYAFNYTTQGAACFINSFYAVKKDATVQLNLLLGTLINIASISFEKQSATGYITINKPVISNQLKYTFEYGPLQPGINYFRAKIVLTNGLVIYSKPEAVYYAASGKYVLLPVPVQRNNNITLISSIPDGESITLMDVLGRIVLTQKIIATQEFIKTAALQSGQYFYRIHRRGMVVASGKLIIL